MADNIVKETGELEIHTENIFPIIKKWLYTDHEIFLRELVSNASDAIKKIEHLSGVGEYKGEHGDSRIDILIDKENKKLTIKDNGIGMTGDEIKKYINQIAFSGAEEFVKKYKSEDENSQIIGHFGLGFYSSYMVANLVEIHSLSHKEGSNAVHWTCDGSTHFTLGASEKTDVGTEIILHINEENEDFLNEWKINELLTKYCRYYPTPIYLHKTVTEKEKDEEGKEKEDGKEITKIVPEQVNETEPIWTKNPAELKEEDYKEFYRKEFPMKPDPLFWIHLNVDFPFNLNGILYFPKLAKDFDLTKSEISLYSNQVFVTNQTQDLLPEYLHLLQGVIDSPDIPLNVSRSSLQSDARVKKISSHISKKIADKVKGLFNTEREQYEKYWEDIHPFIKFGIIKDDDFYKRVEKALIFKSSTKGDFVTAEEYKARNTGNLNKENKTVILYSSDEKQQATYLDMIKSKDMEAVVLDHIIDTHLISTLEMKWTDFKFKRVDADSVDKLIEKDVEETEEDKKEKENFEKIFREVLKNEKLDVRLDNLGSDVSAMLVLSEEQRRMSEMMFMMNPQGGDANLDEIFGGQTALMLNKEHKLVKDIAEKWENDKDRATVLAEHIYDLASMAYKPLEGDKLTKFIKRSNELLG
jgi:molecular chaperone HtpG